MNNSEKKLRANAIHYGMFGGVTSSSVGGT